jgi:hypothetical protein
MRKKYAYEEDKNTNKRIRFIVSCSVLSITSFTFNWVENGLTREMEQVLCALSQHVFNKLDAQYGSRNCPSTYLSPRLLDQFLLNFVFVV